MPVETSVYEEGGWVTDHFSQTPLMSTYYLAWAVCNFTYREAITKSGVVVSTIYIIFSFFFFSKCLLLDMVANACIICVYKQQFYF